MYGTIVCIHMSEKQFVQHWKRRRRKGEERERERELKNIWINNTVELKVKKEDEKNENDSVAWLNSIRCNNNNNIAGSFPFLRFITAVFFPVSPEVWFGSICIGVALCMFAARCIESRNKNLVVRKKIETGAFARSPIRSTTCVIACNSSNAEAN